MNDRKSPLTTMVHIIVGLVVLIVVVNILAWTFRVIGWMISFTLSVALFIAVLYVAYLLVKWAAKNIQ